MSLYHEAAAVLHAVGEEKSSLKTQVFSKKGWKSDPKTLYALSVESTKWSSVLSEVIENSAILRNERQLSPSLALVLTHDLLLSKKGIALPAKHGLNVALNRNKSRLTAELTKARLRRSCATIEDLRKLVNQGQLEADGGSQPKMSIRHIRWVRVNTLKTTVEAQLTTTFDKFRHIEVLSDFAQLCSEQGRTAKAYHIDQHVPNLLAIPAAMDIIAEKAYRTGQLILQDKASCFPAFLLDPSAFDGDVIDSCAAPGNKTTHTAAILQVTSTPEAKAKVIACEKDANRSETLRKMVRVAGANSIVTVKVKQDFMKLNLNAKEFANVTSLLLDPSCSGSGIVGRDDASATVQLPNKTNPTEISSRGRKRKRGIVNTAESATDTQSSQPELVDEEAPMETDDETKLKERLSALSAFQLRLVERAMCFPAARRITYSTCSVHAEENEYVVIKALYSDVAQRRGWKVLERDEQVDGMKRWHKRGWSQACRSVNEHAETKYNLDDDTIETIAQACIRCEKGSEDGTMGFFVAGFVRDGTQDDPETEANPNTEAEPKSSDDEWNGFDD